MIASILEILMRQSRALYFMLALVTVLGVLSFRGLPSAVYPELAFPRIAVIANVKDLDPTRVLLTLTRPLEEAASHVYHVRWIRSKTTRGAAELSIEFLPGTNMNEAWQQLQARFAEVHSALPASTSLIVEPVTPAIFPVINYNITSDSLSAGDLYNTVRYQIEPRIMQVPGVARTITQSGKIPELAVEVDPEKLRNYRISISDVANALARTNRVDVLGRLDERYQQNLVLGPGEAKAPEDLLGLVVSRASSEPVFLKDIARVYRSYQDPLTVVSADGKEGIFLNVFRQPSSNVVAVSQGVNAELARIKNSLPAGIQIKQAYDQSRLVRQSLISMLTEIGIGIALIVITLFLFLRSWKCTVLAAMTIPLCAAASFVAMALLGQSLNLMSLGGLAIALGLVIDDAIVIVENMHRQMARGLNPHEAAVQAVNELSGPVISSTATTLVVFFPLGLITGVAGQFFSALTVTLASAVTFSLFLALFVIPIMAAQWMRAPDQSNEPRSANKLITECKSRYRQSLSLLLHKPILLACAAVAILCATGMLFQKIGSDFLPDMDEGSYVLDYLMPTGTSLAQTDQVCKRIEKVLAQTPEVAAWTRRTGSELGLFATQPNTGDILVLLVPHKQRTRSCAQVMDEQRERIADSIPEVETEFHPILADQLNDLAGAGNPIEVRVFGEDPQAIRDVAATAQEKMLKLKGLTDVAVTTPDFSPQFDVQVDPFRAGRLLLDPLDVTDQVKDGILGRVSTQMRDGDKFVDIRIRLPDKVRFDSEKLGQFPIFGKNGTMLPLSSIADIRRVKGETEIQREHQQRYLSVEAGLSGREDLGSTIAELNTVLKDIALPQGVALSIGGICIEQQETFAQLLLVFLLAAALVDLMMVIQFRSFRQPLAILIVIPLSLLGVEAALLVTHTPLNISSCMGIILLVGLVVKNGIILLEYANRLAKQGMPFDEALVEASTVRMRPILMTTLCTLLALTPLWLAHGAGSELHRPLAVAVIGGLSLSTILTLIFVPFFCRLLAKKTV